MPDASLQKTHAAGGVSIALAGSGGSGVMTAGTLLLTAAAGAGYYGLMVRTSGPQIRGGEAAALGGWPTGPSPRWATPSTCCWRSTDSVGFELAPNEPPYHGVRGQGIATLDSDADGVVLAEMLQRYLGGTDSKLGNWLLSRAEDEILITIKPLRLFSWDYRERMGKG